MLIYGYVALPREYKGMRGQLSIDDWWRLLLLLPPWIPGGPADGTTCHGMRAHKAVWTPWPMAMASAVVATITQPHPASG